MKLKELKEIKLKYNNDQSLGEYFRNNYSEIENLNKEKVESLVKECANDFALGYEVRNHLNEN